MILFLEIVIAAALVVAGLFGLIGSIGLVRLKLPMQRLHAPTKASTVGVAAALMASSGAAWLRTGTPGAEEVLIVLFLFMTAPVTAHFLAKAHLDRKRREEVLPETGTGSKWSTFEGDDGP